jgi:hypothetical protein
MKGSWRSVQLTRFVTFGSRNQIRPKSDRAVFQHDLVSGELGADVPVVTADKSDFWREMV